MNIRNLFHVGVYFLLMGLMLWLIVAVSHGIFVPSVPQAPDYCGRWVSIPDGVDAPERLAGSSSICVEFKNTFERLKYYHNLRMVKRNRILLYIVIGTSVMTSFLVFYVLPMCRKSNYFHSHSIDLAGIIGLGLLTAFSPILFGVVLPSPSKWAPDTVVKYIDSKRTMEIQKLEELSEELDNNWLDFREGTYTNFTAGLEPDGFREIKWGQHISTVLGMTKFDALVKSQN